MSFFRDQPSDDVSIWGDDWEYPGDNKEIPNLEDPDETDTDSDDDAPRYEFAQPPEPVGPPRKVRRTEYRTVARAPPLRVNDHMGLEAGEAFPEMAGNTKETAIDLTG